MYTDIFNGAKMKKLLASLSTVLSLSAMPTNAEEFSVSTTIGFESSYVFRGVQFAETSFQPAINLSYGNFYANAWLNLPIGDDDFVSTPGGEELDLVFGYSSALSEKTTFDVGVTYYTFPDLASGFFDTFSEDGDGLGANTVEVYGGLSYDTLLAPSLYVYHDFMFDTTTVEGGISHTVPLKKDWSIGLGGTLGYVFDDDAGGDYLYGAATADIAYAFSEDNSISAGVRYGGSDIAGGSLIDDSIAGTTKSSGFWYGLSFSSTF